MRSLLPIFLAAPVWTAGLLTPLNPALAQDESAPTPPLAEPAVAETADPGGEPAASPVAQEETTPPAPSMLSKMRWLGRVSLSSGLYDIESTRAVSNGFDPAATQNFESDTGMFGGGVSGLAILGRYTGEVALEYSDIDTFSVTEAMFRLNTALTRYFSLIVGYRVALQGDGFGNDDVYRESGYLAGVGFGPVELPWQAAGRRFALSAAAAYNGSEIDLPSGNTPNADGLAASVKLSVAGSPWAVAVRYRRFEFDDGSQEGVISTREDLTEQYLSAAVEYRLGR